MKVFLDDLVKMDINDLNNLIMSGFNLSITFRTNTILHFNLPNVIENDLFVELMLKSNFDFNKRGINDCSIFHNNYFPKLFIECIKRELINPNDDTCPNYFFSVYSYNKNYLQHVMEHDIKINFNLSKYCYAIGASSDLVIYSIKNGFNINSPNADFIWKLDKWNDKEKKEILNVAIEYGFNKIELFIS